MPDNKIQKVNAFMARYRESRAQIIAARVGAFNALLGDFRRMADALAGKRITDFGIRFEKLRTDFAAAYALYEKEVRLNAPDFNVFKYFGLKETRHSQILADLLRPRGPHGQGDLLLKGFLNLLKDTGADIGLEPQKVSVFCEVYAGTTGGFADIRIESYGVDPFVIIIENKIYDSPDQGKQLERYYQDAKRTGKRVYVVYLTPDPRKPPPASLSEVAREELKPYGGLVCLSCRDIAAWLRGVAQGVEPARLKSTLLMYCDEISRY
jgi:hypothetical protein